jgi:hypothetical protein
MAPLLRISLSIGIVVYFVLIIYFLKKKALNLKYTILWIISGLIMLIMVIFPQLVNGVSALLGIVSPVNTIFVLELFFMLLILMSITSIVSRENEKSKRLIQQVALLEKRIRELESCMEKNK